MTQEKDKQLKNKIELILSEFPETRNSDKLLQAILIMRDFHDLLKGRPINNNGVTEHKFSIEIGTLSKNGYEVNEKFLQLPAGDTVRRIRAHIQNTEGKFPPTEEIKRRRKGKEEEIEEYYSLQATKRSA